MTLAAVKKLAISLPLKQRIKLANELYDSIPPMREPVTLEELEQRVDEIESGKVKAIPGDVFITELDQLMGSIRRKRLGQRG